MSILPLHEEHSKFHLAFDMLKHEPIQYDGFAEGHISPYRSYERPSIRRGPLLTQNQILSFNIAVYEDGPLSQEGISLFFGRGFAARGLQEFHSSFCEPVRCCLDLKHRSLLFRNDAVT